MCILQPDNPHCNYNEEQAEDDSETPSDDMSVGDPCGFLPRYCESAIAAMVETFTEGSMSMLENRTDTAADELALVWSVRDWYRV